MDQARPLTDADRLDWLRLIRSERVGPIGFRQLLARFGGARAALDALPDLAARGGARGRLRVFPRADAEREAEALAALGGRLIGLHDPEYPAPLAAVPDAPPLLAARGAVHLLEQPLVAVVGARNASANGIRFAETLARDLGAAGLVVVSGMARGLDAAAHRGALATGTVAVLAGGVDVVYPRENAALYDDIVRAGCVLAEQPLGLQPTARHFPFRNRIVSGLARGVVVVEATLRSGSLITARLAGEQGREVMAVPGNPLDPRARGTNSLIREGATLVQDADDVLEALAGSGGAPVAEPSPTRYLNSAPSVSAPDAVPDAARERVLALLGAAPVPLDDILRLSGLAPQDLALIVLELELAGRVQRHPGGQLSLAFNG